MNRRISKIGYGCPVPKVIDRNTHGEKSEETYGIFSEYF